VCAPSETGACSGVRGRGRVFPSLGPSAPRLRRRPCQPVAIGRIHAFVLMATLLPNSASGAADHDHSLRSAALLGDVSAIAAALSAGARPDAFAGTQLTTPLLCASARGHRDAVNALLAAKASVNAQHLDGTTALAGAAYRGHEGIVSDLLHAGADVSRANQNGWTPLHCAAFCGRLGAAARLVAAGADVRAVVSAHEYAGKRAIDLVRVWCARARAPVTRASQPPSPQACLEASADKTASAALAVVLAPPATSVEDPGKGAAHPPAAVPPAPSWTAQTLWTIPRDSVVFEKNAVGDLVELGVGMFGSVYAASWDGHAVAVKVPRRRTSGAPLAADFVAELWSETAQLCSLRHPNIVEVYGAYDHVDEVGVRRAGMVMQRCRGGTLRDRLGSSPAPSDSGGVGLRISWWLQVAHGVAHLHRHNVIHGDLKPENVLFVDTTAASRAVVTDLGQAVKRGDDSLTRQGWIGMRGTLMYMDPCLMQHAPSDEGGAAASAGSGAGSVRKASDVYSMGVLLWECAAGAFPYHDFIARSTRADLPAPARQDRLETLFKEHVAGGGRPAMGAGLAALEPAGVGDLIGRMWDASHAARPSMQDAISALRMLLTGARD
jgi:hypothetical protein